MAKGINSFFSSKGEDTSRVARFKAASVGKSKKEIRELETTLLAPEEIQPYAGSQPSQKAKHPLLARTVKFVFHSQEDIALFKKHFRVSNFIEMSVADPSFLMRIVDALESGEIKYDRERNIFTT